MEKFLALLGLLAVTFLYVYNLDVPVSYVSGTEPTQRTTSNNDPDNYRTWTSWTWDVRTAVATTFRAPHRLGFLPGPDHLVGRLRVALPDSCSPRIAWWQISIDDKPVDRGRTLAWVPELEVPTEYRLAPSAREITLTAGWNGGDAACPSFTMIWDAPSARA